MRRNRLLSLVLMAFWSLTNCLNLAMAQLVISSDTTWTPGSMSAGVTWNAAQQRFEYNNSLTINSGRTLTIRTGDGINGGNFLLTLPNGGTFLVNGILTLSAQSGNGNGGNLTVNLGGATGTINIAGTIRSNGLGTGSGGIITLNGSTYTLASSGVIEALGGTSGGAGGVVDLTRTGSAMLVIPSGFDISTTGTSSATTNLITITANNIQMDGILTADGISNSSGGTITLVANGGRNRISSNGRVFARGNGSGDGGTLDVRANEIGIDLDIDDCKNNSCTHATDNESILVHNSAQIRLNGGSADTGVIKIGRAGAGNILLTMGKIASNNFQGINRAEIGNDGITSNTTVTGYSRTADFGGTDPTFAMYANNGIVTATNTNDFGNVEVNNTSGNINITDTTGGMTVSIRGGSNTATVIAQNSGTLTINNSNYDGTLNLQTNGNIATGVLANIITGPINIYGQAGAGNRAGTVNLTNTTSTNINAIMASAATITANGATSDLTVTNLNITNGTTLNAGRDVIANAVTNNFGTTTAATGRNISLRDNTGTFTINGITATGTLDIDTPFGSSITLANVDATGTTNVNSGGGAGTISGSTGLVFRGDANFNANNAAGGNNITLTGDFQGNTTFTGDRIQVTDNAGNFSVTGISTGSTVATSTLTASAANSNLTVSGINLDSTGATFAGRLDMSANKNVTIDGTGWNPANDTINAWSTNGGNMAVSNVNGTAGIDSTNAGTNPNNAAAGIHLATVGGTYALDNNTVTGATTINATNTVTGTGNTFQGTTAFNSGAADTSLTSSDFQSITQNTFSGRNITVSDTNGLTVTGGTATGTSAFTATGAANDLTISNYTATGGTSTLTSGRHITATTNNNFGNVAVAAPTGTVNITDTTGGMTVTSMTASTATLTALASGALGLQNTTMSGTLNLQSKGAITATTNNNLTGTININGDAGAADRAGAVSLTNANTTSIGRIVSSSGAITSTGAASDITITNLDITGATSITSGRDITASAASNNFGTTTAASGRNIALNDNAGNFTLNGVAATGTLTVTSASNGNISLANVDSTGTATITAGGGTAVISGSTGNVFRGAANINAGSNNSGGNNINLSADFQANSTFSGNQVTVTDTAGNFTVTGITTGNSASTSTLTANAANSNLTVSGINLNSTGATAAGRLDISADKNISINGTGWTPTNDVVNAWSRNAVGGNMIVSNVNGAAALDSTAASVNPNSSVAGIHLATNGGSYTLTNNTINGATDIQAKNVISGTGNTFVGTTNFDANLGTAYNINMTTSDFQNVTNVFDGANVTISDNAGGLTITGLTASGTGNVTTSGVTPDMTISNASVTGATTLTSGGALTATNNNNFGTLTVSTNGTTAITEQGTMTISALTNSSNNTTTLASANGSVTGKNTAVTDVTVGTGTLTVTAGDAAGDTGSSVNLKVGAGGNIDIRAWGNDGGNNSIILAGTVGGNATALNGSGAGTTGHIYIGQYSTNRNLSVTGTTNFNAGSNDAFGQGVYTGAVSGTAGRVGIEITSGNFTSGGVTATGSTGWWGAADETMIIQTRTGDILGSGYTTSGAGNMRLQAGAWNYLGAGNDINVTDVSASQNLGLFATGDTSGAGTGNAIVVGGNSSVGGYITASGIDASNYFAGTKGHVNISLNSGDLKTALVWAGTKYGVADTSAKNVTLTANNGSILQDASIYENPTTFHINGKTIFANGNVSLTAQGNASSHINTGVNAIKNSGTAPSLTAKAQGDSLGNGSGISIQLYGRVDGNVTATNLTNGRTTGNINLGTSVGDPLLLNDVYTVEDVLGSVTAKTMKNLGLYGSFYGPMYLTAATVNGYADKGPLNIGSITTDANSGLAINLTAAKGNITGGNISTAGTSNVFLQAGSQYPRDKMVNIDLSNVTIGGNFDVVVSGSSNGAASGSSIRITGASSIGGTKTGTNESGGAVRGTITW